MLWADEIIVADSHSTDGTIEIAEGLGARVVQIDFNGFGDLRNRAIEACRGDWIFSLDSDERCTPEVRDEILSIVAASDSLDVYRVPRRNYFMGRWIRHSGWYPNFRQPQLFRRGAMAYTLEPVHEGYRLLTDRPLGVLTHAIWQFPFRNLGEVVAKLNRYSTLGAAKVAPGRASMARRADERDLGLRQAPRLQARPARRLGRLRDRVRVLRADLLPLREAPRAGSGLGLPDPGAARPPRQIRLNRPVPSGSATVMLKRRSVIACAAGALAAPAWAQFRVEISGVGATQLPIAIAKFRDEDRAGQAISAIVRADLERSGVFRIVEGGGALDETSSAELGRVARPRRRCAGRGLGDPAGRWPLRRALQALGRGQGQRAGRRRATRCKPADLRLAAHRIADTIYEKLTGEKGVFSTRIAYVTRGGGRFTLRVADADGEGGQVALNSAEPIISPAWSPNGRELAYVSFESQKAVVYIQDVATGNAARRRQLPRLEQRAGVVARRPDAGRHACRAIRARSST